MVPPQATAAALIVVGWLMITALTEAREEAEPERASVLVAEGEPSAVEPGHVASTGGVVAAQRKFAGIDFHDLGIGVAAALTIMIMPFTYSITNGIGSGSSPTR